MMYTLAMQSYMWVDFTTIKQRGKVTESMYAISIGLVAPMVCLTANCISLVGITVLRYSSSVPDYSGILVVSKSFNS